MNIEKEVDFILVGQGLAGSALALELTKRNKRILVFDQPDNNKSSAVAAGLFNPITGRIMTKTWKADLLFPFLIDFYSTAEKNLGAQFFKPKPLYRPFISVQEQNEWMGKSADVGMKTYLKQTFTHSQFGHHVYDDSGGLLLSQCGYVDTNLFISAVRKMLIANGSYSPDYFTEANLIVDTNAVFYSTIKADKVILCNGNEALNSIFFNTLPFRPLKGETIEVRIDQEFDVIYNRGVYVVPSGKTGYYKVGATYDPRDISSSITELARKELSDKLLELLKVPFEITNQDWGIRPSTADRRPFLGSYPDEKKVAIFNGLGTKGVSLAPYFASQLSNWLLEKGEIDSEVDINRFKLKK
jgi:glycine oxidase